MTEPEPSKDYWDIVFAELRRRSLFRIALVLLIGVYASAVYAPLIANDRPYVLEAIDFAEYGRARRTLYPAVLGLGAVARKTPEEFLETRIATSDSSYDEALERERLAVHVQVETMRRALSAEGTAALEELLSRSDQLAAAASSGDRAELERGAEELKVLGKAAREDFRAHHPARPEEGGVELLPRKSYPLFEVIGAWEAFFMVLWALLFAWPLWNRTVNKLLLRGDRERIRRARRAKLALVLLCSAAAGIGWRLTIGGEMTFATATFKEALTAGEIVATRAVFPPLPLGFAETNPGESFRPPTWHPKAEISEEGYYVRGARVPTPDPVTGFVPPPNPVPVRFAERESNDPLRHPLGTDSVGRDLLVRMLWGGRVSLSVGLISALLLVVIGTAIGAVAGYFGGCVDLFISRFIEVVLCFPAFFLILMVVAVTNPNVVPPIIAIVVVIALVRWTGVARLARGEFLRLREEEFVVASRALGFSTWRTIFRHILPNATGPILVAGAFAVSSGILTESALSFLGFGIQHPVPSWGSLVNESRLAENWWIQVFPGLAIFVTVLAYNLVGEAFRDALDPRLNRGKEERR